MLDKTQLFPLNACKNRRIIKYYSHISIDKWQNYLNVVREKLYPRSAIFVFCYGNTPQQLPQNVCEHTRQDKSHSFCITDISGSYVSEEWN